MPKVLSLGEDYDSLNLIMLSIDKDSIALESFIQEHYSDLKQENVLFLRATDDFKDTYRITGVPRYILIDRNGQIIDAFMHRDVEVMRKKLDDRLEEE